MLKPFVLGIERTIVRLVNRPGRFDAPPREGIRRFTAAEILAAPVGTFELPAGDPLRPLPFSVWSKAPVADGSGDLLSGVLYRPRGAPERALLLVPGWLAGVRPYFEELAARAARRGAVAALLDLPAHFGRTPPGARSGQLFFGNDPARSSSYLRQAVSDSGSLLASLEGELPDRPLVAAGSSLGGWVAGVAASHSPRAGALLLTPAADPASLLRSSPLLGEVRASLARSGHDPAAIADEVAPLALRLLPAPRLGARLLAAVHDAAIPVEDVLALASAWRSPVELHPVGHMTPYVSSSVLARLERSLESFA